MPADTIKNSNNERVKDKNGILDSKSTSIDIKSKKENDKETLFKTVSNNPTLLNVFDPLF